MNVPGNRCAVLGDPIGHSLSPVLHTAAYQAMGLDWTYEAVRVPAGSLAGFLDGLDSSWRGLSLTMPLKREVLPLLASQDPWVVETGACNTVVIAPDGSRHGSNTDVTGALRVLGGDNPAPRRALVLGGGATATSVLIALRERGLTDATLAVRNPETAAETLSRIAAHPDAPEVEVRTLDDVAASSIGADILVSTVPVAAQTPALLEATREIPVIFDVIYDPWPTPLASAARDSGRGLHSGLDLLVAQAVDQVRLMTGRSEVPEAAMRRAAEAALESRS